MRGIDRIDTVDVGRHFVVRGTFVVSNPQGNWTKVYNMERAAEPMIPASTFKIPNTIIALETGVASGADFTLPFDSVASPPQPWWPESWRRSHTLRSAFQNSVVWFYQELARRIGPRRMEEYLRRLDYGNQSIGGGIDRFWLDGDLRISALQQVDFLRRFYSGELPVSGSTVDIVKDIMILEDSAGHRLSGKTGTASIEEDNTLGWFVGSIAVGDSAYYFALNFTSYNHVKWTPPQAWRVELVWDILTDLHVVPARVEKHHPEPGIDSILAGNDRAARFLIDTLGDSSLIGYSSFVLVRSGPLGKHSYVVGDTPEFAEGLDYWTFCPDSSMAATTGPPERGDPDNQICLWNRGGTGSIEILESCGTPCVYLGVHWLDNHRLIFAWRQERYAVGTTTHMFGHRAMITVYDLDRDSGFTYQSAPVLRPMYR
ncbi:MAG: penicillin-binding transpeptidase domain-containing protein [Candidatus Zixiibacteriota bacterium]